MKWLEFFFLQTPSLYGWFFWAGFCPKHAHLFKHKPSRKYDFTYMGESCLLAALGL